MTNTFQKIGDKISTQADLDHFFSARNIDGNSKAKLVLKKDGTLMSVKNLSLGEKIKSFFRGDTISLRGLVKQAEKIQSLSFLKTNANFALLVEKRNCGAYRKIKFGTVELYKANEEFRKQFAAALSSLNINNKQKLQRLKNELECNHLSNFFIESAKSLYKDKKITPELLEQIQKAPAEAILLRDKEGKCAYDYFKDNSDLLNAFRKRSDAEVIEEYASFSKG